MEDKTPDSGEPEHQTEESETRHEWISVAAYYKALHRGFVPGQELDDWLAAEADFFVMLISRYLCILEEDGAMTFFSLRQLAKAVGVKNPEHLHLKVDLVRAIQETSRTRPCFQFKRGGLCTELANCQWKRECRKLIAVWKSRS